MKFFLLAVFAIASVNARATIKNNGSTSRAAPWYDCSGQLPGNYVNPRDCTRFITCDAGLQAIERDCGDCSNVPEACTPQNRLVYNATVDACLWADETRCESGSDDSESEEATEVATNPTTTKRATEASTNQPTTETTDDTSSGEDNGAGDNETEGPSTEGSNSGEGNEGSDESLETTTEKVADPEDGVTPAPQPEAGQPCNPEECKNTGYCQTFLRCDKEKAIWVEESCGDELFWNPRLGGVHGGNCDFIDNIDPDDLAELRKDPECLACFWRAEGECSSAYKYQAPDLRNRNVLDLSCPRGLVFSQEKETCQHCGDVKRSDGGNCC